MGKTTAIECRCRCVSAPRNPRRARDRPAPQSTHPVRQPAHLITPAHYYLPSKHGSENAGLPPQHQGAPPPEGQHLGAGVVAPMEDRLNRLEERKKAGELPPSTISPGACGEHGTHARTCPHSPIRRWGGGGNDVFASFSSSSSSSSRPPPPPQHHHRSHPFPCPSCPGGGRPRRTVSSAARRRLAW